MDAEDVKKSGGSVSGDKNASQITDCNTRTDCDMGTEYGVICVDIGTTTIAMQLRDGQTGRVVNTYTGLNPQKKYGADVLSRISAAEDSFIRHDLMQLIIDFIQSGIDEFNDGQNQNAERMIAQKMMIAGNTAMIHFLMNYDTDLLGKAPFIPFTVEEIHTTICGLSTTILPGVSAFVGADIISGIYALDMEKDEKINLLIDLGTNGEIILGNQKRMIATSTAAGPAFESGNRDFAANLMAYTASLLQKGMVDETGLLKEPYFSEGITIGSHKVTQQDIRQLQMAKAAICCGIEILCEKYGITNYEVISHVYLAGGMGYYLSPKAAGEIGLLPWELVQRAEAVGNTALEGAFVYYQKSSQKLPVIESINLAMENGFDDKYMEHMNLQKV